MHTDPDRAALKIADMERLSREALSDVRRAVEGYRVLTLPGELERARVALAAAGIEADVPTSADEVAGPWRELIAWTVREGVTNVLRHSRARRCTIELTPDRVVVRNDTPLSIPPGPQGHGLSGLRERAAGVGAQVHVRCTPEEGFVLEVTGPSPAAGS